MSSTDSPRFAALQISRPVRDCRADDPAGAWPGLSREELTEAVHDNLPNLGLEVLADLPLQGLIRHIGLSNVTPSQIADGRKICEVVCLRNHYNVPQRHDDALVADLARDGIASMPYFPLGGFTPLQSFALSGVAARLGPRRCR